MLICTVTYKEAVKFAVVSYLYTTGARGKVVVKKLSYNKRSRVPDHVRQKIFLVSRAQPVRRAKM
jgi:hypothetical protein